MTVLCRS